MNIAHDKSNELSRDDINRLLKEASITPIFVYSASDLDTLKDRADSADYTPLVLIYLARLKRPQVSSVLDQCRAASDPSAPVDEQLLATVKGATGLGLIKSDAFQQALRLADEHGGAPIDVVLCFLRQYVADHLHGEEAEYNWAQRLSILRDTTSPMARSLTLLEDIVCNSKDLVTLLRSDVALAKLVFEIKIRQGATQREAILAHCAAIDFDA